MKKMIPRKILFIRLDRIGDLVLTLPVDESLHDSAAKWWIPKGLSFVTMSSTPMRRAEEISKKITLKDFIRLLMDLRREPMDAAIVFHAPWWVSLLIWLARIPIRGGVRSQWHSFLFFNRGVRQKRSRAEFSELEYNYQLLEAVLGLPEKQLPRTHLKLKGAEGEERDDLLRKHGLFQKTYAVVHPGMGGSALNWPTDRYVEYVQRLTEKSRVVITGTHSDEEYLSPIRSRLEPNDRISWLNGLLNGRELITVLSNATSITAPSTGVLHLAASTGRPTLGIFSPVRVQQPKRWGPMGEKTATLMPSVPCPAEMACLGSKCPQFPCMESLAVEEALKALDSLA